MDIRGFLRWQFEGTFRSLSFYGLMLGVLALILGFLGLPYMGWIFAMGAVLIAVDMVRTWFRFSYSIYDLERQRIEHKLRRKE